MATQSEQIKKMRSWLHDWYGIDKAPALPPGGEQTLRRLEGLEGEDFDLLMSTNFIRHHLTLLPRADRCTDVAFHEKLRALCDTMYQGQLREIETLTEIIEDQIPR